jgi:hypothetical protein
LNWRLDEGFEIFTNATAMRILIPGFRFALVAC